MDIKDLEDRAKGLDEKKSTYLIEVRKLRLDINRVMTVTDWGTEEWRRLANLKNYLDEIYIYQ